MIAVLCGGVGAARLLAGLVQVADPAEVTAIVNTGDDTVMHGLCISPDLDTIMYTLSGRINPETGWGLAGDEFTTMSALAALGGEAWFGLGNLDLATHMYRTDRLAVGATLTEVTAELARSFGLGLTLLPMSDQPVHTRLHLLDGPEIGFQEYFVKLRHSVAVRAVRYEGASQASPAAGVLEALESAEAILIAPSNPVLSIDPILAVPGIKDVLARRRHNIVAVSPIIDGATVKGPADRLLTELGAQATSPGVARWLAAVAGTLVIDEADAGLQGEVEAAGLRCVVTPTLMSNPGVAASLALTALQSARAGLS